MPKSSAMAWTCFRSRDDSVASNSRSDASDRAKSNSRSRSRSSARSAGTWSPCLNSQASPNLQWPRRVNSAHCVSRFGRSSRFFRLRVALLTSAS